ncbi:MULTISPECIES: hypothetical protein [Bacillus]|uniref:hypothetical protein n=1 Tax=Bacillus TaxID=1386 RepID=UPI001E4D4A7E|nr:hypothetical protein [Bacillus rhizoplanae]
MKKTFLTILGIFLCFLIGYERDYKVIASKDSKTNINNQFKNINVNTEIVLKKGYTTIPLPKSYETSKPKKLPVTPDSRTFSIQNLTNN